MRITHLGHACVLVELDGARLLFDPGTLSSGFEDLVDLDAVLVTHGHDDHVDAGRLGPLLERNPQAVLLTDADTAASLALQTTDVLRPGDVREVAGVRIEALGGEHAKVWRDVPQLANLAYLVGDGAFLHPGDSFVQPGRPVDVLLVAISGPWVKIGDAVEHVQAVAPRVAIPAHEAALSNTDQAHGMLADFAPAGTTVRPLERGVATEV